MKRSRKMEKKRDTKTTLLIYLLQPSTLPFIYRGLHLWVPNSNPHLSHTHPEERRKHLASAKRRRQKQGPFSQFREDSSQTLLVGNVKWYNHFGTQAASWKGTYPPTIWLNCHAPTYLPKKMKAPVHTKICTWIFIAALCIISKNQKQSKCPATGEQMNNTWYVPTTEYYSAKKEWITDTCNYPMNLKIPTLSKRSQAKEQSIWDSI